MSFAFYINNHLLINHGSNQKTAYTKQNQNVVALYNQKEEIIGFNLLELELDVPQGLIMHPSNLLQEKVNTILKEKGFEPITLHGVENIVVGKVLTCLPHPDSDHMHVTTVDVKDEILTIVCGAKNIKEGIKVVVAKPNTMMFDGTYIEPNILRNVKSYGMICSGYELNLEGYKKGEGIIILDDSYEIGSSFFK